MTEEVKTDAPEIRSDLSENGAENGGLKSVEEVNAALGLEPEETKPDTGNADAEKVADSQETDEDKEQDKSGEEDPDKKEDQEGKDLENKDTEIDWEKRYKDSQREINTKYIPLEQDAARLAQERQALNAILAENPEARKALEAAVQGRQEATTKTEVKTAEADIKAIIQEALAPYTPILEEQRTTREQQELQAFEKFEAAHEDLTPQDRATIGPMASYFEKALGLSKYDALERSFGSLFPEKAQASAKENAERQARIDAKASEGGRKAAVGGGTSQAAASSSELSADEKFVAEKMGMSEAEYLEMKRLNTYNE